MVSVGLIYTGQSSCRTVRICVSVSDGIGLGGFLVEPIVGQSVSRVDGVRGELLCGRESGESIKGLSGLPAVLICNVDIVSCVIIVVLDCTTH